MDPAATRSANGCHPGRVDHVHGVVAAIYIGAGKLVQRVGVVPPSQLGIVVAGSEVLPVQARLRLLLLPAELVKVVGLSLRFNSRQIQAQGA